MLLNENPENYNYTNEELAKYLEETQDAVLEVGKILSRFISLLKANNVIDETDRQYILGNMSEEEYIKHFKESHALTNMLMKMFEMATPEKKSDNTNEDKG